MNRIRARWRMDDNNNNNNNNNNTTMNFITTHFYSVYERNIIRIPFEKLTRSATNKIGKVINPTTRFNIDLIHNTI